MDQLQFWEKYKHCILCYYCILWMKELNITVLIKKYKIPMNELWLQKDKRQIFTHKNSNSSFPLSHPNLINIWNELYGQKKNYIQCQNSEFKHLINQSISLNWAAFFTKHLHIRLWYLMLKKDTQCYAECWPTHPLNHLLYWRKAIYCLFISIKITRNRKK